MKDWTYFEIIASTLLLVSLLSLLSLFALIWIDSIILGVLGIAGFIICISGFMGFADTYGHRGWDRSAEVSVFKKPFKNLIK
jgi:hypothetical protein